MGILDPPALPPWLARFHMLSELGDEGIELTEGLRRAAQASGSVDLKPINLWFEKVRAATLSEDSAQKFESAVASAEAWAAKYLQVGGMTSQAMHGFANGLQRVVEAVREGGGASIRDLGENAVTFSIVSHVHRFDRVRHGMSVTLRDASQFGIDEHQLARFVELLEGNEVFDTHGDLHTVSLTEHGRQWFDQTLRDNATPSPSGGAADGTESDGDVGGSSVGATIKVDEVRQHLAFMTNDELRGYVVDDLREINATFPAGANLSTMILCGSAVEGMVLDVAEQLPGKLACAGKQNWADSISLPKIVEELAGLDLLTDSAKTIALGIGDHRDLVHPNRRRKSQKKIRMDSRAARAMMNLVEIVARDLYEAAMAGAIDKLK